MLKGDSHQWKQSSGKLRITQYCCFAAANDCIYYKLYIDWCTDYTCIRVSTRCVSMVTILACTSCIKRHVEERNKLSTSTGQSRSS